MNTETPNAAANDQGAAAPDASASAAAPVATQAPNTQENATPPADAAPGAADEGKDGQQAAEPVVPEAYAAPEMPEGIIFDEGLATAVAPILQKAGVTQEAYNELAGVLAQQQIQAQQAQLKTWTEACAKDPDINANDGALRKAAIEAVGQFGSPELKALFNASGLGSQPDLVKLIGKLGQAAKVTNDRGTDSAGSGGGQRSLTSRMYPNQ